MLKAIALMLLVSPLASNSHVAAANPGCTLELKTAGLCADATTGGGGVIVEGSQRTPGNSGGSSDGNQDGGGGSGGGFSRPSNPVPLNGSDVCSPLSSSAFCAGNRTADPADPAAPAIPDVTLADIATFVPSQPEFANEPAGLGVVGMPTNFVSSASPQAIGGRLLDTWDVVVHFTPEAFRFDYGDGASQTTSSGGATWASLGQAEYTPTSTSHTYSARGTYTASVTVLYSAWVDFGSGISRTVDGYVESTAGGFDVRVVEVHTALVDKTCIENPSGPGC